MSNRVSKLLLTLVLLCLVGDQVKSQVKPTLNPKDSSQFLSFGDEAALTEITDQSIEELKRLIARFSKSKNRGEMWLRLADLYVEKAQFEEYKEYRRFDQKIKDKRRNPRVDLSRSKKYYRLAIRLYERFVRHFPKDKKMDQALFFLGFNYFELKKPQKGAIFYRQLTQNFPKSPYVSESSFALGEYHFEREEWGQARTYYQKVAKDKSARLRLFSLYKTAWCFYRGGNVEKAVSIMERVLLQSRRSQEIAEVAGTKKINRVRLTSEALSDLIPFYADSDRPYKQALSYLTRIGGGDLAYKLLDRLAYYYSDTGQRQAARFLFRQLIDRSPLSPKAFDYQYQIVNNYVFSTSDGVFKKELIRWIRNYGPDSRWYQANKSNKKLVEDANQVREATLRNYVLNTHQTARNSRQTKSTESAKLGYQLYIKAFPKTKKKDLMQFYYGELLFESKNYKEAAIEYAKVLRSDPKGPYVEPAVINSTIALEKALPSEKSIRRKVGESTDPVPFSKPVRLFELMAKRYKKSFPKGDKYVPVTFKLARLYYLHNQFDLALEGFNEVVKREPKSKLGEYSANLVLDIYHLRKDYKGLKAAGRNLLKDGVSGKVGGDIKGLIERSAFKTAQTLEGKKKFLASAREYEKFAREQPDSELATKALFNAAVNYERGKDVPSAIRAFSDFSVGQKGKDKKLSFQADEALARLLVDTAQFGKAAKQYQRMAKTYPKNKKVPIWHFNAAVIWDDLEFWDRALAAYKSFQNTERKKEREEGFFYRAEIWRKRKNSSRANNLYKKFLQASPASAEKFVKAQFQIADFHERRKQFGQADKEYKRLRALGTAFDRARKSYPTDLVQEAHFRLAKRNFDAFLQVKVPKKESEQRNKIARKLQGLERVKSSFTQVISKKGADHVISSLVVLGRAHWHMYNFFWRLPKPKGLSKAESREYRKQLKRQTETFKASAKDYYIEAIAVSKKSESYNRWVLSAHKELSRIDPSNHPFYDEKVFDFREVDWMTL